MRRRFMASWLVREKRAPVVMVELLEEATRRLVWEEVRRARSVEPAAPRLAVGKRHGAGDAPAGAVCAAGVAIGPAGAGFFCARSATVTSIARSIGIRATPLFLSTHAYVVRSFWVSSRNAFNFSMRFFARASS